MFAVVAEHAWQRVSSASPYGRMHAHNLRTRDFALRCVSACDESNRPFAKNPDKIKERKGVNQLQNQESNLHQIKTVYVTVRLTKMLFQWLYEGSRFFVEILRATTSIF